LLLLYTGWPWLSVHWTLLNDEFAVCCGGNKQARE